MTSPLPSWANVLRPAQRQAIDQVMASFSLGNQVVLLDAPTGSGKTLIAEMVRRAKGVRYSTYVAHSKSLQDQFLRDFKYARVLKGRTNYPTLNRRDLTAADCTKTNCHFCQPRSACPYLRAKAEATSAEVAVLNTSYLLSFPAPTFFRDLVVIDECDTLENILINHYEFYVGARRLKVLGLAAPVKGAHTSTLIKWLDDRLLTAAQADVAELRRYADFHTDEDTMRVLNAAEGLVERTQMLIRELTAGRRWVRDYNRPGFSMRPVEVTSQGAEVLWNRGRSTSWLAMSATVINADEWVKSTGVEAAGLKWDLVTVSNEWPRSNRPIVGRTWGDMGASSEDISKQRVINRAVDICKLHRAAGENVLIHAVSYKLADVLYDALADAGMKALTYDQAAKRDLVLEIFKEQGGILIAASMDRGIDLPDDLCRVQIIPKVPYLYLGDRQVAERLRLPDGDFWYQVQAARSLVQMTGRAIRHKHDYAVTYILDEAFDRFYMRWSRLLPKWWRDSIVGELPDDWWKRKDRSIA